MQGALWVQLTQTLICNDKVNDGAYLGLRSNFPPGHAGEPQQPDGLDRQRLVLPDPVVHRLHQVDLALAAGARLRGGGAGALRASPPTRSRAAASTSTARQCATTNFGLSCVGGGGEDGPRRARLRGGDVEPRGRHGRHGDVGADRALPLPVPARQAEHRRRRAATAAARGTSACGSRWKTPFFEMQNIGNGRVFMQSGLWGGYPAACGYRHNIRNTNFFELVERGEPYPVRTSPTPRPRSWPRRSPAITSSTSRPRRCPR